MPNSPPKACSKPGCPARTTGRFCALHTTQANKAEYARRDGSTKYYKTKQWLQLRRKRLIANPFCQWPMPDGRECGKIGKQVDHIKPREYGGPDTFDNTQTLCTSHHSYKTRVLDTQWASVLDTGSKGDNLLSLTQPSQPFENSNDLAKRPADEPFEPSEGRGGQNLQSD